MIYLHRREREMYGVRKQADSLLGDNFFLRDTQDSEWRERLGTLERAG